jgi:hypothetical protein
MKTFPRLIHLMFVYTINLNNPKITYQNFLKVYNKKRTILDLVGLVFFQR